jgi:hypothetical protein
MTASPTRGLWLVVAASLMGACGTGVDPEADALLESGESRAGGLQLPAVLERLHVRGGLQHSLLHHDRGPAGDLL